ncbi:LytR C-terminal domain-containing protein [Arthrobacter sp. Z4-13]
MPKYARDEFDKVPETASRQGVHRTASASPRVRLWPILAVGMAALAIGLVSFLILPKLGFSTPDSQASSSQESAPLASTGGTPSATPDASAEPSAEATPPASSGPEATADPEPELEEPTAAPVLIDKTQSVAIYNAAGTAGLAGRVGGTVQADGWTLGEVGNWAGAPQQASVVYYQGAEQLPSAQALAALLGIPTVVDSSGFQVPLVVVLGPGYV